MSPYQIAALAFIVIVPLLVWSFDRQPHTAHLTRLCERTLALALILAYLADWGIKIADPALTIGHELPLQLCDWALLATSAALWWRWLPGFDVAYFWGLAGTLQALFTPAVASNLHWMRLCGFFFIHAGIVAGVLHLVLTAGFRPTWPASIVRVVAASEVYLGLALAANALTGDNYGFLSHKPASRTMLDIFSTTHWLYLVEINLFAFLFFAVLYVPWLIVDISKFRRA